MDTVEYIELFWDCPKCGKNHISAVFNPQGNRCPNCWSWRVEDIKLYEAPDSQIITDPKLINRQPFWACKVCDAANEDIGLQAHLLQCGNCDSYQVSDVGIITGNQATDQQSPDSVSVGEIVEFQKNGSTDRSNEFVRPRSPNIKQHWRLLTAGLAGLTLVSGGFVGNSIGSDQMHDPAILQVQVTDLKWTAKIDVQKKKISIKQSWRDSMPTDAVIVASKTKQRGSRKEQRGSKTVMVKEQYQSDTNTETYSESERYQSGTNIETYYESERYQSGTNTETYYESEQYQSGTERKCETTSRGNGIGQRTCHSVPVYGTRQVPRRRSVPVYSTRQVPRTRSVPVYSTRQVPRTRSVPVYSTRTVSKQQPIIVSVPVQDTWVTYRVGEWLPSQTHHRTGQNRTPQNVDVKLGHLPPERISATQMSCYLTGSYPVRRSWLEPSELKLGWWKLPCQEYNQIHIGEQVKLRQKAANSANLVHSPTN